MNFPSRLRPRGLAACLVLALLSIGTGAAPGDPGSFVPTTVFLVRHAEKAAEPREDPPLTEAGVARSRELARVLGASGVAAIHTSQFLRTRQTAAPLAEHLGFVPAVIPVASGGMDPGGVSRESIGAIADAIRRHPGRTALIVGHSNTIPEVIRALGGSPAPAIGDREYDDLFVVTVYADGKATVGRLKYGAPSPAGGN